MTNSKIVLDSNIFIKLFFKEEDRLQAIELIKELGKRNYQVLAPNLFLYEVLSVAAYSEFPTWSAYELIRQHQKVNLQLVDIDEKTIRDAIGITEQGHRNSGYPSFYDSAYHALAIGNTCQFVTADKRHEAKTKQVGYITLLKDWEALF